MKKPFLILVGCLVATQQLFSVANAETFPYPLTNLNKKLGSRSGFSVYASSDTYLSAVRLRGTNDYFTHRDVKLGNLVSDATMEKCINQTVGRLEKAEALLGLSNDLAKDIERKNKIPHLEIDLNDMRKLPTAERTDYDNEGAVVVDKYSPDKVRLRTVLTSGSNGKIICNSPTVDQIVEFYQTRIKTLSTGGGDSSQTFKSVE